MKIAEINTETVYWYERQNDWGTYLRADSSQGAVKRVDDKRYHRIGYTWSNNYREDPQGKYILAERVAMPGDDYQGGDQLYILAAQVRDEYQAVKDRYEATQTAKKSAAIERQRTIDALHERADGLRARLVETGLDKLIHVRVVEGSPYRHDPPRMDVTFNGPQEGNLGSLLTYVEGLKALA